MLDGLLGDDAESDQVELEVTHSELQDLLTVTNEVHLSTVTEISRWGAFGDSNTDISSYDGVGEDFVDYRENHPRYRDNSYAEYVTFEEPAISLTANDDSYTYEAEVFCHGSTVGTDSPTTVMAELTFHGSINEQELVMNLL